MSKVYLLGASGHGKVVHDILTLNAIEVGGFYDKNPEIDQFIGLTVLGEDKIERETQLIITVGANSVRRNIARRFNKHTYLKAIHPNSLVANGISIGIGTVVMSGAVINPGATIGKHVIINTSASIDHDCLINDYVHISPGAVLTGSVYVGEGTHIGANATIIPNLKIGKWVTIGAGTVVLKDVPDYAVVVGNPGMIIKYNSKNG